MALTSNTGADAGGALGGAVGTALGGPVGGAAGALGGSAVGRVGGAIFGSGDKTAYDVNSGLGGGGGTPQRRIPRLEGETEEAYRARVGAMTPEQLIEAAGGISALGGGRPSGPVAMPVGSYEKTGNTANPNMNSTWANFIAPTWNQIAKTSDKEMEFLRRTTPRGGGQDRALADAGRGRFGAMQNAWQSLVPGAISGLSQIGKEMYFQQPQGSDALGTMAGLQSANQQYNLGLQQLKSQENQAAQQNKSNLLGTAGSVLGQLGAAYLGGRK